MLTTTKKVLYFNIHTLPNDKRSTENVINYLFRTKHQKIIVQVHLWTSNKQCFPFIPLMFSIIEPHKCIEINGLMHTKILYNIKRVDIRQVMYVVYRNISLIWLLNLPPSVKTFSLYNNYTLCCMLL